MKNVVPIQILLAAVGAMAFGLVVSRYLPGAFRQVYEDMVQRRAFLTGTGSPLKTISQLQQWLFKGFGFLCMGVGAFFAVIYLLGLLGLNPLGIR